MGNKNNDGYNMFDLEALEEGETIEKLGLFVGLIEGLKLDDYE